MRSRREQSTPDAAQFRKEPADEIWAAIEERHALINGSVAMKVVALAVFLASDEVSFHDRQCGEDRRRAGAPSSLGGALSQGARSHKPARSSRARSFAGRPPEAEQNRASTSIVRPGRSLMRIVGGPHEYLRFR